MPKRLGTTGWGDGLEISFPKVVDSQDIIAEMLHYIVMAATTNSLQRGSLKQQKILILQFCRSEV